MKTCAKTSPPRAARSRPGGTACRPGTPRPGTLPPWCGTPHSVGAASAPDRSFCRRSPSSPRRRRQDRRTARPAAPDWHRAHPLPATSASPFCHGTAAASASLPPRGEKKRVRGGSPRTPWHKAADTARQPQPIPQLPGQISPRTPSQISFSEISSSAQVTSRKNSRSGIHLTSPTPAKTAIAAGTARTAASFRFPGFNWPSA